MLIRLYFLLARRECVRAAFMHAKKPVFLGVVAYLLLAHSHSDF
jgi:hypothetical protein